MNMTPSEPGPASAPLRKPTGGDAPRGESAAPPTSVARDVRPPRSWYSVALWTTCLLIGYALSPLPVGVLLDLMPPRLGTVLHRGLSPVYAPLNWLSKKSPRVRSFYDWYENLLEV